MTNNVKYRICAHQSRRGERKWHFVITSYCRSERFGWRCLGDVAHPSENLSFDTLEAALTCAETVKEELTNNLKRPLPPGFSVE
jgi:hypothetical protein